VLVLKRSEKRPTMRSIGFDQRAAVSALALLIAISPVAVKFNPAALPSLGLAKAIAKDDRDDDDDSSKDSDDGGKPGADRPGKDRPGKADDDGDDDDSDDDDDDDQGYDDDDWSGVSGDYSTWNSGQPRIELSLTGDELNALVAGKKVLIDNLGRVLELEVEEDDGRREVIAKPQGDAASARPGAITSVRAVDLGKDAFGRELLLDPDGHLLELQAESTPAAAAGPRGSGRGESRPLVEDLVQVGDDLSPEEEAGMIERGWK
jgi:hypothetical protein